MVDDDIDAGDLDAVLWAMCTRFDPKVDIDLVQKAWASKRDPLFLPGNFNNRILIDACIPYDMKLKGTFPPVVDVSANLRAKSAGEISEVVSLKESGEWSTLSPPAHRYFAVGYCCVCCVCANSCLPMVLKRAF